jgi:hypothetical protein
MMQKTFGAVVGLEATLPVAPHPADLFKCEDSSTIARRDHCRLAHDGTAWMFFDSWEENEGESLARLADKLYDDFEAFAGHDDAIAAAKHNAFATEPEWPEYVKDYYRDDCEIQADLSDSELSAICAKLYDCANGVSVGSGLSGLDCVLTSWEVQEYDHEVLCDGHSILASLDDCDDEFGLEYFLDQYCYDHKFVITDGKYAHDGCMNWSHDSDKTYWWGCSHETMWDVYVEVMGEPVLAE